MPARDGRGPLGEGPLTGRGLANCSTNSSGNRFPGRGRFFGRGGFGFGGGRRFGAGRFSDTGNNSGTIEILKEQVENLSSMIEKLKYEISNISKHRE